MMLKGVLNLLYSSVFTSKTMGETCMPHEMRGKVFHEFIVGNHHILMKQVLREFSSEFKIVYFPFFFHIIMLLNATHHKNGKPNGTPSKLQRNQR